MIYHTVDPNGIEWIFVGSRGTTGDPDFQLSELARVGIFGPETQAEALAVRAPAGMSGFFDWLKPIGNFFRRIGEGIAKVYRKIGGGVRKVAEWLNRQTAKVCVQDCGTLWIIDSVGSTGYTIAPVTGQECRNRTIVPPAAVPGWESPCPPGQPSPPWTTWTQQPGPDPYGAPGAGLGIPMPVLVALGAILLLR